MTLVRSPLPRLSGNSYWLLVFLLAFVQCKTLQTATKDPTSTEPNSDNKTKIDTLIISEPDESNVIIVDPKIEEEIEKDDLINYSSNSLGIILPLNTESISFYGNQISSRHEALVHYYLGIKLALRELNAENERLNVLIDDSKNNEGELVRILSKYKDQGVKYIFGGRGKAHVSKIAAYAEEHDMIYVSGWQANSKFLGENRNYVQLNPGFQAHVLTILNHALAEFRPDQIKIFGSRKESNRINEINRLYQELTGLDETLESFIVESMEELEELEMTEWMENPEEQVFIVPVTRDYNLIHDFFRFLSFNELHERSIVYGVTDWNNEKLFDHLNNFDVRLTAFWNPSVASDYNTFEESFYSMTGTRPKEKAFEGYGHVLMMADLMKKSTAEERLAGLDLESPGMKAFLVDHNVLEFPGTDRSIEPSYFENKSVHLLGFKDFRYFILSN